MRYARLKSEQIPRGKCLQDTVARILPFWNDAMAPAMRSGPRLLVSAHGKYIRARVKYLDGISDADLVGLNIPDGNPLAYELDEQLRPLRSVGLGDPDAAAQASAAVAAQSRG